MASGIQIARLICLLYQFASCECEKGDIYILYKNKNKNKNKHWQICITMGKRVSLFGVQIPLGGCLSIVIVIVIVVIAAAVAGI